ncbi:hypothetical protein [Lacticaseibacillus manihotivorans]|uniref:hypothetical protein n=1 Tax=Lacticaseibacillus manihotivorans TaxID=88233 RepID=UPI0006D11857|nr:hypothetical protein [Lacticaseibacillus manihotivorans]
MFTAQDLKQALPQQFQSLEVTCVARTTSTNQVMAANLLHESHQQLLIAGEQTQGVGRRAKPFSHQRTLVFTSHTAALA